MGWRRMKGDIKALELSIIEKGPVSCQSAEQILSDAPTLELSGVKTAL